MIEPTTTVGVVVATYQGERWVDAQLRSILDQTRAADLIVVTDDGSRDGTVDIARALTAGRDVKILTGRAGGTTANFERGLQHCDTDIIFLADQDDVWFPTKIATMLDAFDQTDAVMVCSDAEVIDAGDVSDGSRLWPRTGCVGQAHRRMSSGRAFEQLLRWNVVTGATMAIRQQVAIDACPLPTSGVHDWSLALVAAATGQVALVNEPLMGYRLHDANQVGLDPNMGAALVRSRLESANIRTVESRQLATVADLLEHAHPGNPSVARLRARSAFSARRATTRARGMFPRFAAVGCDVARGRYYRFAHGFRSVLLDLVPEHDTSEVEPARSDPAP